MNKFLLGLFVYVLFANLVYSLDKDKHCKCRIRTDPKIIGGKVSQKTDFPWMVSLSTEKSSTNKVVREMLPNSAKIDTHICGGVIVNERWILTAAHCISDNYFYVGYGNNNDLVKIYDAGRIKVKKSILHPGVGYVQADGIFINDIALLELESPIEFTNDVLPGCLDTNFGAAYDDVLVAGYGQTSKVLINPSTNERHDGEISRFLKELEYKDISSQVEKCSRYRVLICVNREEESICYGDSGSPMHKTINGRTTIVGLASSVELPEYRGDLITLCNGGAFYTRVGNTLSWIEKTIGGEENHC